MIEQEKLPKQTFLASIQRMLVRRQFRERINEVQEDILKLNGLEAAIETIMMIAEGGNADISS